MPVSPVRTIELAPRPTLDWLSAPDNPAVAVLTRRTLLGEPDSPDLDALWATRNDYPPVATILAAQTEDGSWAPSARDYQKYRGSLWQVHFLGELRASGEDERVQRAAAYAFSRQLADGSWSCNGRPSAAIPCLTANVGRALARLGWARDERVIGALAYCVELHRAFGRLECGAVFSRRDQGPADGNTGVYTLNGYCHMLAPKTLLFLAEVPRDLWPDGAQDLRDDCVAVLRDKHVFRCLPAEAQAFREEMTAMASAKRKGFRARFLAEHEPLHYQAKPGWLKFGYPLSYNSDALEALAALAAVGEPPRQEHAEAIDVVRDAANAQMRWKMRNSLNGKMYADVETRGEPSKWLTLRALQVLGWAEDGAENA